MLATFTWVPLAALFIYLLEFCTLAAAKKNGLIRCFLVMLLFLIVWSAGSALMRVQFFNMIAPWFHLSLAGIWIACLTLDELLCRFQGKHMTLPEKALGGVLVVILVVNIATNWFLAPPTLTTLESGRIAFVYGSFTVGTYLMYGLYAVFSALILIRVVGCVRCRALSRIQALPISAASVFIIAGQVLILLPPFTGIPLDLAMGIVFGIFCFVSLYNKHLFSLTLAFSAKTYALFTVGVMVIFCMQLVTPLQAFFSSLPSPVGENAVVFVVLLAVSFAFLLYAVLKHLSGIFFLKDQTSRSEGLKAFQEQVSRSLSVADTSELFCHQVCADLRNVRAVRIGMKNQAGGMTLTGSSIPFEAGGALFGPNSAVVEWLTNHDDVLTKTEFSRSIEARSMWESERQQLQLLDVYCILPLVANEELIGIATVTMKDSRMSLQVSEMDHLLSLAAITAIGIKNSQLYEQAAYEARTDDLTGLMNRKYLFQELESLHDADPHRIISVMVINLDDFKLYNQLYGEAEGDIVLQRVAGILKTTVGESNLAARLGGKEFVVLMPDQDISAAKRLAENLRLQIYHLNRDNDEQAALKVLTCSIGICGMPFDAHTTKQLMDRANMAVYLVKQRGKNAILVYSTGIEGEKLSLDSIDHKSIYSSYADTIYALTAAIDAKDHYTFTHSNNVAYYASVLASAYGLNADTVEIVREAGLLHDVGKIGIPESVLKKPGSLTADEYEIIKKHPENAVSIIRHLPSLDYVIPAVVGHHERWDGKGYPRRLAGEDIPLTARILCVADTFDAITSRRCYQNPREIETALQIIENGAGTQFDPELATLFVRKFREGAIELQTGRFDAAGPAGRAAFDATFDATFDVADPACL